MVFIAFAVLSTQCYAAQAITGVLGFSLGKQTNGLMFKRDVDGCLQASISITNEPFKTLIVRTLDDGRIFEMLESGDDASQASAVENALELKYGKPPGWPGVYGNGTNHVRLVWGAAIPDQSNPYIIVSFYSDPLQAIEEREQAARDLIKARAMTNGL